MKKIYVLTILSVLSLGLYSQTEWVKHPDNPVIVAGPDDWEDVMVTPGSVIFHEGKYHMWYSGGFLPTMGGDFLIGHATSIDGISWEKDTINPVLDKGQVGDWDDHGVWEPSVMWVDSLFHMWYSGYSSDLPMHSIGHATSPDGINWTRDSANPVLQKGTGGEWDASGIIGPGVIFDGNEYHMYYSGHNSSINGIYIGHATSPDGIQWTKDEQNPVVRPGTSGSWDFDQAYYPEVLFKEGSYHLWYAGGKVTTWQLGYSISSDGSNWTPLEENPVLTRGEAGSWESQYISISSVMFDNTDSIYKMWYHAGAGNMSRAIGYAEAQVDSPVDPTGQSGKITIDQIRIYPNPVRDLLHIHLAEKGTYTIEINSLNGQTLQRKDFSGTRRQLDLSSLSQGAYFLTIRSKDAVITRKIIKMSSN